MEQQHLIKRLYRDELGTRLERVSVPHEMELSSVFGKLNVEKLM